MISLPLPSINLVFSPHHLAVNGTLHSYKSQLWPPPLLLTTTLNPSPSSVDFTFLLRLHSYTFLWFQGHRPHPNHCNLPISHCTYLLPNSSLSVHCPQAGCDHITPCLKLLQWHSTDFKMNIKCLNLALCGPALAYLSSFLQHHFPCCLLCSSCGPQSSARSLCLVNSYLTSRPQHKCHSLEKASLPY